MVVNSTSIDGGNTTHEFQGCFADTTSGRILAGYTFSSSRNMTVENCISGCKSNNYTVSGVENARDCYCGGASLPAASLRQNVTECEGVMCSGDTTQFCGAASRLAVYA